MTDAAMVRQRLLALADPANATFSASLIPGADNILGVKLPELRKLAAEIARGDWRSWLAAAEDNYMEEIMLQGMVIGAARAETEEILGYTITFIDKINNWAICDSFCSGFLWAKSRPELIWSFIRPYFQDPRPYAKRFATVMLLSHYVNAAHIEEALLLLDTVEHEDYYVKMGVAWALSVCYVHFPQQTLRYLSGDNRLDKFTYNKALQKAVESRRVSAEDKLMLRGMKRK